MTTSVDSLIESSKDFAGTALANAVSAANLAINSFGNIGSAALIDPDAFVNPADPAAFVPATPPVLTPISLKEYAEPGDAPVPEPVPSPLDGLGEAPLLTAVALAYKEPMVPSQLGEFSESAPSVETSFEFPSIPDALSLSIEPPVLATLAAPVKPQVLLPTLDALPPTALASAPTDYVSQFTSQYHEQAPSMYNALEGQISSWLNKMNPQYSSQLSNLQTRLNTYMAGGTALTAAVQDAIYERSKDKNNAEYRRTREAAFTEAAKRGFTMPDGALFSAMQQARQAGADNNARAATEIGVKIAEMEQQNIQFAVTQATSLTQMTLASMISYHQGLVGLNGQALEAAKGVLNALVESYNAVVRGYGAKIEGYKAEVQVFEAKIRAAMSGIELYRAEISALEAMTNVDRAKVDIYRGRIDALNSLASVYKTEVEAVVSRAGLEKLKIELYGAQVQAYQATVQAKSAEFQGYAAAVGGEEAKVRVYGEQVKAHLTGVTAWKTTVEGKMEQIRAISLNNQTIAEQHKAIVGAYEVKVRANAQVQSTKIDYGRELIQEYSIANNAAVSVAEMQAALYRTKTQNAIERARLDQTKLLEEAKISVSQMQGVANAATALSGVYANLAGSAMSGVNTLVSTSSTE